MRINQLAIGLCWIVSTSISHAQESEKRPLEVLFFGDDAYHHPLDRYQDFKEVSGQRGIHLTYEKRMEALNPANLSQYDAVLIYANHQEISPEQLAALTHYVDDGGGFVPVHCGSACFKKTDGYIALVGGQIENHGEGVFTARITDPDHPTMQGYKPFETWDETYHHHRLEKDLTILQRNGDEPWTWVRTQGKGRVFYTAYGHDERCWHQDGFQELLTRGLRWAAGEGISPPDLPELKYEVPLLPERYQTSQPVPKIQQPLAPEESLKLAQVPPGFEVSLFASEPDVVNPIAIHWDHRGRLWVVETLDYPNHQQPEDTGNDRLKIYEDTDGDGKADRFTVFADGLSLATSVVEANGGVIVSDGPRMLFLQDTDGDDHADVRKVLFEGFKKHDTHAGQSNLRYGFDGWIYATIGYAGFEGEVGGKPMKFDTGAFRFLPDDSKLEFLGKTSNNTWGLGFTEQFDVMGSTANRQPSWQIVGDNGPADRADRGTRFFPITQDVQQSDGWEPPIELLGNGKIRAKSRHYTAAAGHAIYTARRFPESWWNRTAFVCEPTGHLVSVGEMRHENAEFFTYFEGNNLYASADAWSAPVAAEVGPDGAVWIADWYNIIVQHNRPGAPFEQTKVDRGKGAAYVTPLREKPLGRIYRVYPKGSKNTAVPSDLIDGLSSPNLFWRQKSQQQIVEQRRTDLQEKLLQLAESDEGFAGDHALWALHGLGAKIPTALVHHTRPERRRIALTIWDSDEMPDFDPAKESDALVRREWLLLAGRMPLSSELSAQLQTLHDQHADLFQGVILQRCLAFASRDRESQVIAEKPKTHPVSAEQLKRGETIYGQTCIACHQADGTGVDSAFPPLDGSKRLTGNPEVPIRIVLHGLTGVVKIDGKPDVNSLMPPVMGLSDADIADVLSYVRHSWSNDARAVQVKEVEAIRSAHESRQQPWNSADFK
ncbi:PVC-type heme-binding CxxCH protein [Luteolibacter pohnpeiensis]|uniref:PVC-type heme-binding CxxCH protein n=1 Tax=Luteolibacter pohnpeiensis TaxID=454153 RepID=UPI0019053B07|nr:PVC-type heme-binding CxxCH protein [Luteolibacter pohnpeiensis]